MDQRTVDRLAMTIGIVALIAGLATIAFGRFDSGVRLSTSGEYVVVAEVQPRSIAAVYGLRPGMIITQLQGVTLLRLPQYVYPEVDPTPDPVTQEFPPFAPGFVLKTSPLPELLDAIRRVAAGGMAFAVRPSSSAGVHLTGREREVVGLVVDGRSNDEIRAALGIGVKMVETHLARLFLRFDVASRTELATKVLREGWLDVPPADR